jgi:hypothetical protein
VTFSCRAVQGGPSAVVAQLQSLSLVVRCGFRGELDSSGSGRASDVAPNQKAEAHLVPETYERAAVDPREISPLQGGWHRLQQKIIQARRGVHREVSVARSWLRPTPEQDVGPQLIRYDLG